MDPESASGKAIALVETEERLLAERRQRTELLLDGDLQVMPGHALVIGSRLDLDRQSLASVGGVDLDHARARAIRGAGEIRRDRCLLRQLDD
jgi:hypothetical protein